MRTSISSPQQLKKEFLKKWVVGLRACSSRKPNMTIFQRLKAIKLSADVAMASTRNGSTCWSRAVLAANGLPHKSLLRSQQQIVFSSKISQESLAKRGQRHVLSCKKILKRSCFKRVLLIKRSAAHRENANHVSHRVVARSIAKRLVKKRTNVLRRLVPGGEFMDDTSLIEETLDYILSLQAQVDVMRTTLAKATTSIAPDSKFNSCV